MLGNDEGRKEFDKVPAEVGTATHAFAAFEPSIESKSPNLDKKEIVVY